MSPKHSERRTAAGTLKGDANMRGNASGITVTAAYAVMSRQRIDDRWLIRRAGMLMLSPDYSADASARKLVFRAANATTAVPYLSTPECPPRRPSKLQQAPDSNIANWDCIPQNGMSGWPTSSSNIG